MSCPPRPRSSRTPGATADEVQVLDVSALAEMLLQTDAGREVLDVLESDLHAPELIVPECLSVLRG